VGKIACCGLGVCARSACDFAHAVDVRSDRMGNGEEADTHPPATPRQIRRIQLLSIIGDLSVIYNVYAWHTDAERMATKSSHWPCPPAAQLHRPFQLEFIRPV